MKAANKVPRQSFIQLLILTILMSGMMVLGIVWSRTGAAQSTTAFRAAVNYPAGNGPKFAATGDFNGDSKPDIIAANFSGGSVSVMLGNGDGTFQSKIDSTVAPTPTWIAVGDFNNDGKQDIAVAIANGPYRLCVLLGNGDGTFQSPTTYTINNNSTRSIAVADFNGDGKQDLLVFSGGRISILYGNGDGTFQDAASVGLSSSTGIFSTGDFNGDGKIDLVSTNFFGSPPSVCPAINQGDGTFRYKPCVSDIQGTSFAVGDFNADGKLDFAVANFTNPDPGTVSNISVLLGNGDGTFQSKVNYPVGSAPFLGAAADFNGDGKLDLVTANDGDNNVSLLLGNGDGTFQARTNYATAEAPQGIAVADFNTDTGPDLVTANNSDNNVSVLLNNSVAAPTPTPTPSTCATAPSGLVAWYQGEDNANDIAGGNNGTPQGNVTYVAGKVGQAFSFNADQSAVAVGNPTQLQLQDLTIEAWIKRSSATQITTDPYYSEAAQIFACSSGGYNFFIYADGHLALGKTDVGAIGFPDLKITDTNFHHVAVTKSGTDVVAYLDGTASSTNNFGEQFTFTNNSAHIGAYRYGERLNYSFYGAIDELSIYNRPLSQTEIQSIYNAGSAGKCGSTPTPTPTPTPSPAPDLGVFMRATGSTKVGELFNYYVYVTNYGSVPATNVQLADNFPSKLEFRGSDPSGACNVPGNITSAQLRCNLNDIQPGQSKTIVFTVKVVASGDISNTASASATQAEPSPDPHPNSATVSTASVKPVDLSINLIAPIEGDTSKDISYNIKVANTDQATDAHNVVITETPPGNVDFVSLTPPSGVGVTCNQASRTCHFDTIEHGSTYGVTLKVHPRANGSIGNTVKITSAQEPDPNLLNNTASAYTQVKVVADLSILMSAPSQVTDGSQFTYVITARNNGPSTAANVLFYDTLPSEVSFVSVTPGTQGGPFRCGLNLLGKDAGSPDYVACQLGNMSSGSSAGVRITVRPKQSATITNIAAVATFEGTDPVISNNETRVSTVTCAPGSSAVPVFNTSSPLLLSVGQSYVYNARATDPRGRRITYALTQAPAGMTIDASTGNVNWTAPGELRGQLVPVNIVATNGTCNGTAAQSFTLSVADEPPPGGYKLSVGNVTISSTALIKISDSTNTNNSVNSATAWETTRKVEAFTQDTGNGTYKLGGDIKINNYLYFNGDVTVIINRATAIMNINVSKGRLYLNNIPRLGQVTLWQGGGLNMTINGNGEVTKFLQSNVQTPLRAAGVDITIQQATLLLTNDLGIRIQGKLNFPTIAGVQGLSGTFSDLYITQARGVAFTGQINVPAFEIGGIGLRNVQMNFFASPNGLNDVFRGKGTLTTPPFNVAAQVEFVAGSLNSVKAVVSSNTGGVPVPPFFNITAGTIDVQNIRTGPFTIALNVDLTIADPSVANILKLSHAGITYTAPNQLRGSSDLEVLTVNATQAFLNLDFPNTLELGGDVDLLENFTIFKASVDLSTGVRNNIFFIQGAANAVVQIPDGNNKIYDVLRALGFRFPYVVAQTNIAFSYPPGKFVYTASLARIDVTVSVAKVAGAIEANVGTNFASFLIRVPSGNHAIPINEKTSRPPLAGRQPKTGAPKGGAVTIAATTTSTPQALGAVTVPASTPTIIFALAAASPTAPRFAVIKPDGTRITPDNAASFNADYAQNEDTSESFYVVSNPEAGDWSIEAEDGTQGPFTLNALGANAPPVIASVQAAQSGANVTINYNATDADDAATVSLFYASQATGFKGQLIVDNLPQSAMGSYMWDTSDGNVPAGDYYVYAIIDDGKNQPARLYAPTRITVADPFAPATPQDVVVQAGSENSIFVSWTPNTESNLRGYQIRYAVDNGDGTELTGAFDAGNQTSARLPGLANSTAYRVAVVAYNQIETADPADPTNVTISSHSSTPSPSQTATTGIAVLPVVQITSPAGGDVVVGDDDINISWMVDQGDDLIEQDVEISLDGGATFSPLRIQLDGQTRNFLWHVPASVQTATARVRVTTNDASGNQGISVSDADFSINAPAPGPSPTPTPLPAVQFSAATYTVNEGATSAPITVTRTGDGTGAISVQYATGGGTANAGSDYTSVAGTLIFADGVTSQTFNIPIQDDGSPESNETVMLTLGNPAGGATLGIPNIAVLTITDKVPMQLGDMLISEFRLRGTNGAQDEFIELYNNSDAPVTVSTLDNSSGWAVVAADGEVRFIIPNGTVIPARGHYLGVNSAGYSLGLYPAGNGTTATGDNSYTVDIADNTGLALFKTASVASFTQENLLDAVGFAGVTAPFYTGSPLPLTGILDGEYSMVRKADAATGLLQNTQNNAADFAFVSTNGTTFGGTVNSILGNPAPENLSSPALNPGMVPSLTDPTACISCSPNRARNGSGSSGTLAFRRHFTNNTGNKVSRLRLRVTDITTLNSPVALAPQADLRLINSQDQSILTTLGSVNIKGTTLETPLIEGLGGGLNSSVTVTLAEEGLADGQSIDVELLLNVVQNGRFRFFVSIEALP
jgi:uncharacterized repeat protein (TIGR01451 family)